MSIVAAAAALLTVTNLVTPVAARPVVAPSVAGTRPAPTATASWMWPLSPRPDVVRPFSPPEERWLAGHRGVDLLTSGPGAAVLSPADGLVRFSGRVADKEVVVIEHHGGLRSTFEPASSPLAVGTPVRRGQTVGVVAETPGHCAPATCLHWGVLRGDVYLDPLALVGPARVRLLPLS